MNFYAVSNPIACITNILTTTHENYGKATSLSNIASHLSGSRQSADRYSIEEYYRPENSTHLLVDQRANAMFVILARNSNTDGAVRSVREIEDSTYPYVFSTKEPFTGEFKKRVSVLTNSKMESDVIPRDHWFQPDWIDEEKATAGRKKLEIMTFYLMRAFGRNHRVVDDK